MGLTISYKSYMNLTKLQEDYGKIHWAGKKCFMGMPLSFTTYIVTDTKLITRTGLLSIKEDEIELYRIIDKSLELPIGQRLFSCGSIKITAKDSDTPIKVLKSIKNPRKAKKVIDDLVDAQRNQFSVRGRDMYGAATMYTDTLDSDGDDPANG